MKTNRFLFRVIFIGLITAALTSLASAEPLNTEQDATRSPGDMTTEERIGMMKAASGYDNCVYSQAMASIGNFDDIRHAADFAMGECQNKLDELHGVITGYGMPEAYASSFTQRIRSRATRKLLPELAIRKAGG